MKAEKNYAVHFRVPVDEKDLSLGYWMPWEMQFRFFTNRKEAIAFSKECEIAKMRTIMHKTTYTEEEYRESLKRYIAIPFREKEVFSAMFEFYKLYY